MSPGFVTFVFLSIYAAANLDVVSSNGVCGSVYCCGGSIGPFLRGGESEGANCLAVSIGAAHGVKGDCSDCNLAGCKGIFTGNAESVDGTKGCGNNNVHLRRSGLRHEHKLEPGIGNLVCGYVHLCVGQGGSSRSGGEVKGGGVHLHLLHHYGRGGVCTKIVGDVHLYFCEGVLESEFHGVGCRSGRSDGAHEVGLVGVRILAALVGGDVISVGDTCAGGIRITGHKLGGSVIGLAYSPVDGGRGREFASGDSSLDVVCTKGSGIDADIGSTGLAKCHGGRLELVSSKIADSKADCLTGILANCFGLVASYKAGSKCKQSYDCFFHFVNWF